jgi:hypothetical protein
MLEFFGPEMRETAEQEHFPSSIDVPALGSRLARSESAKMPMRRFLKGCRTRLG